MGGLGSITWNKEGTELLLPEELKSCEGDFCRRHSWNAAWKDFVSPSFGYPAELGSTFKLLALPEESLPCVFVCLAHLLQPFLGV